MIRAMSLAGLLPLLALALTVGLFRRRTGSMSEAIVLGALAWSFAIALGSEALSIWHAISFPSFSGLLESRRHRAGLGPALARPCLPQPRKKRISRHGGDAGRQPHPMAASCSAGFAIALARPRLEDWIAGCRAACSSAARPCSSLWSARRTIGIPRPTILPRIEHWIQNRSLDFYLTAIDRQLMLPDFAETLILQLRLLSGGDRLDNIVQWLAGAGSVILVGRIALALGASRRGVALARLTAATLPIGILESTSTQNDLVVTFFLMCTAERLLAWRQAVASRMPPSWRSPPGWRWRPKERPIWSDCPWASGS